MLGMDRWDITSVRTDRYCTLYRGLQLHKDQGQRSCTGLRLLPIGVSVSISMPMNVSDSESMYI